MKKCFLTITCAMFVMGCMMSCGSKDSSEAQKEAGQPAVTEEVVEEEGTPDSRATLADAEAMCKWLGDLNEKFKAGKLSDEERTKALSDLIEMSNDWNKKYKKLKEQDYTPAQWSRLQEIEAKVKELMWD